MISLPVLIGGLTAIFLGSFVQGTIALGYALVAVPILILFLPPQTAIPVLLVTGLFVCAFILWESRKWLSFRSMIPVSIFGVAATPLGTWLLLVLEIDSFKIFIGAVISTIAILFLIGFRREIKNEKLASLPIGIISGVLQGSLTMCGPPVILFLMNQGVEKRVFRANFAGFIMVMNISAFISFFVTGLITSEVLKLTLYFFPAMLIGVFSGIFLSRHINESLFRRIALIIVAAGGLSSALSGLGLL